MNNICIVVIGYNRLDCMKRLIESLQKSYYDEQVDLIISIDNSGNESLYMYAEAVDWEFGEKKVIIKTERLGLKKHVIECGNMTKEYEHIVVLEDDIYVSPYFFNYAKQAIDFYKGDDNIAGISLYKHKRNIYASKQFQNIKNEYDSFFIKYAQSWGQVWSRKEWANFIKWYENQDDRFEHNENIPGNLFGWSDKSWLKYHIRYCIENNKYFVYPTISHSSNFNNIGSHALLNSPAYQTELMYGKANYKFMPFNESALRYDQFFENESLASYLGISENELCIDIYGMKKNKLNKRYWLTTRVENFKILRSFGLELKPHEMNIINNIEGNHIFLYDTTIKHNNITKLENHKYHLCLYYYGEICKENLVEYTKLKYKEWFNYIIKKIKSKF